MKLDHSYGDGSIGVYYKTGEYGATDGMKKTGVEGSLWGIGIGHSLGGGAHAYAGYRQISEDGHEGHRPPPGRDAGDVQLSAPYAMKAS